MSMQKKLAAGLMAGLLGCGALCAASPAHRETLHQVALLQSLAQGYLEGVVTVKDLRKLGDTGIGTFEGLNGEMIVLDGVVYQALGDGSVIVAPDDEMVPFCNVTFFDRDHTLPLYNVDDKEDLERRLDRFVAERGRNNFYMVKIFGTFEEMLVRSEDGQEKPYPTLVETLAKDQHEFPLQNVRGVMVGLYCPDYMSGLNSTGWHFHFLSEDRKQGGHVLGLSAARVEAWLDATDRFAVKTPDEKRFHTLPLARNMNEDIHRAEHATKDELR